VGGPELQRHLILLTQVQGLKMPATAQIPHVQPVAVAASHKYLGIQSPLDHVGCAPLAGDHGVVAQVPPEVVSEVLRTALDLPASQRLEGIVVHDEDAARSLVVALRPGWL
jgi:hypothetical protein